jgi:hypothetical protein
LTPTAFSTFYVSEFVKAGFRKQLLQDRPDTGRFWWFTERITADRQ